MRIRNRFIREQIRIFDNHYQNFQEKMKKYQEVEKRRNMKKIQKIILNENKKSLKTSLSNRPKI